MEELGLLTQEEVTRLHTTCDDDYPYYGELSFLPMAWATMVMRKVFEEGLMIPRQTPANGGSANGGSYPTVVNMAMKALHGYRLQYGTMLFEVYFPFPLLLLSAFAKAEVAPMLVYRLREELASAKSAAATAEERALRAGARAPCPGYDHRKGEARAGGR